MEYWTKEQAEQFADLQAKELSNRLIFLQGKGVPKQNAPIGAIYQDNDQSPVKWYRKVGAGLANWQPISLYEKASLEHMQNGVNDETFITPLLLTNQLDQLKQEILNYPVAEVNPQSRELTLTVVESSHDQSVMLNLPAMNTFQNQLLVWMEGYEEGAVLTGIEGGEISQIITLRRKETALLSMSGTSSIRLSGQFQWKDIDQLDNINLQKIDSNTWVEISRKSFNNT